MTSIFDALVDILASQARGEDVEECLVKHAEHREELRGLLETVRLVEASRPLAELTPDARERIGELLRRLANPDTGSIPFEGDKE